MQRGQYEMAMEKLKSAAIAQDQTYAPAHTVLAVYCTKPWVKWTRLRQEYREALKYDPSDGDIE